MGGIFVAIMTVTIIVIFVIVYLDQGDLVTPDQRKYIDDFVKKNF